MNKKPLIFVIFIILSFTVLTLAVAQNRQVSHPRLESDPKAVEYYRIGSRTSGFSWTELAEICLWASGDVNLTSMQKLTNAVTVLNSGDLPRSGKDRAIYILEYMHTNILKSYSLNQTRVDTIFTNGRFNCVSSAALYMILCKSAGVNTSGVMTRHHAFVIAHIDGQNIDVETTNRYGFDPGNRKEFHDQFGALTGFTYVPATNYRDRQTINQIELASLIFNNRIVELEKTNRYADAVPLAIDRAVFLLGNSITRENAPSGTIFENPRKDLLDRLLNYGASLLRANREEDALVWAASASARYPDSARWQEFVMAAVNNRVARFLRERKIPDARNFLDVNASLLSQDDFSRLDTLIIDSELLRRANNIRTAAEADEILNDIETARNSGKLNQGRARELLTFTIQKTAALLCAPPARDWRAAVSYLENALSRFGANRELEQNLKTYRDNLATDYHNRFAAEWNKKNYAEAERILNEGLSEFPDNRQLLSNRDIVNKQKAQ
ncbi:MAG: hypothetical protein FWB73_04595 [Treponema sp.]|nr:hypothetical protein [Treponema sp.]